MCGILGWVGSDLGREAFEVRLQRLRHRGPDSQGIWEDRDRRVLLGHRRLAIIDLGPGGAQPRVDGTGRWVIVFNGEIYNFQELRHELEGKGIAFASNSDTEVLLEAFKQWGQACLPRLNGMFAFAIYDRGSVDTSPSLFLARDRTGKKPLYYVHNGTAFAFASEPKALDHDGSLDLHALNHYLAYGYYPGELCFQEGMRKLRPGHCATYAPLSGVFNETCWWRLPDAPPPSYADPERLTDELAALLVDAVRLRLISDVPVGVFLSGGLDSSLVTAAAVQASSTRIKTFTIRVPSTGFDESTYARLVATHFGTEHHELVADAASLSVLDDMAGLLDEPLADSSLLPTFIVSRLTRQHVTVALGGGGGDELFGGYPHVRRALVASRLVGWVPPVAWSILGNLAERLPVGVKGRNRAQSWRQGPLFERVWGTPYFDRKARERLLTPDARAALADRLLEPERRQRSAFGDPADPVAGLGRLDFTTTLPDDFLVKIDRASMMSSLEVRAPFLDPRLVDFAFTKIPSTWKCDGRETRRIERRLARRWLPRELDIDRKQGFSVPVGEWFRAAGPEAVRARLEGLPDVISKPAVEAEIRGHMAGRQNGSRLFALAMLAECARRLPTTGPSV